ncbi:MAG: hypothetical protein HC902_11210 [Calothrix sp. SM1_5_4]|nr:hypothetical protein [Calothrix sp. SM1_5_4]
MTEDLAFEQVMRECMSARGNGTWITEDFIRAYTDLHEAGYAHSVEIWHQDELVGGFYGVFVDGVFSGESMFHKRDNVVKLALWHLIERLSATGHGFIDTQQARGTSLALKWGATEIPSREFHTRLRSAQAARLPYR